MNNVAGQQHSSSVSGTNATGASSSTRKQPTTSSIDLAALKRAFKKGKKLMQPFFPAYILIS